MNSNTHECKKSNLNQGGVNTLYFDVVQKNTARKHVTRIYEVP